MVHSKGVDFYYLRSRNYSFEIVKRDVGGDFEREFTDPNADGPNYSLSSKELNGSYNPVSFVTGEDAFFEFFAKKNGGNIYGRSMRVGTIGGNINPEDIRNLISERSIITADWSLSFGLYDSDGANISQLPNRHQVWACLTDNRERWQETLLNSLGTKDVLLKHLVLPGSHDAGMYLNVWPVPIANLANTQKEDVTQQLKLGARFFDFRPASLRGDFPDHISGDDKWTQLVAKLGLPLIAEVLRPFFGQMRHIHGFIPGATLHEFIDQIKHFLEENRKEIVVVKISSSGIKTECAKVPSSDEVLEVMRACLAGSSIKIGDKSCLNKPLRSLTHPDLDQRLIVLFANDVDISSSYDTNSYEQYESQMVIDQLNKTMQQDNTGKDLIDLQLQLTATSCTGAIVRALAGSNYATSPLLATKARTDRAAYTWLLEHLKKESENSPLISIIDDFFDNGLTEIAFEINRARLARFA